MKLKGGVDKVLVRTHRLKKIFRWGTKTLKNFMGYEKDSKSTIMAIEEFMETN